MATILPTIEKFFLVALNLCSSNTCILRNGGHDSSLTRPRSLWRWFRFVFLAFLLSSTNKLLFLILPNWLENLIVLTQPLLMVFVVNLLGSALKWIWPSPLLLIKIRVDGVIRQVEYEGLHVFCFECGCVGHTKEACPSLQPVPTLTNDQPNDKGSTPVASVGGKPMYGD